MAASADTYRLSSPRGALFGMGIVLVLVAFTVLILFPQVRSAYLANISLNTIILTVLAIGIILAVRQVLRLLPEIRWVNAYRLGDPGTRVGAPPRLLGPMAALLDVHSDRSGLSPQALRSILDSIGTRLDESREILRYMTGVLVFLGLLGTFWGLQGTVSSVGNIIGSLQGGDDFGVLFEDLKEGLEAPLAGMGIAFSSSLFGLASSLVLGFLDLLGGQAQSRFYTELEDWLTSLTGSNEGGAAQPSNLRVDIGRALIPALQPLQSSIERVATAVNGSGGKVASGSGSDTQTVKAIADLAEGVQGILHHMRIEQQVLKEQIASQSRGQEETRGLLERLVAETRGLREDASGYRDAPSNSDG